MSSAGLKATMSPRIKTDQDRMMSQSLQALPQSSRVRRSMHGISSLSSTASQDDDLSSQDRFSLSSNMQSNQASHGMDGWTMASSGSINSTDMTPSEPESPEVQMLSFPLSQQLMSAGHGDSVNRGPIYSSFSDFQAVQDVTDNDMDFTQAQDFHQFSSMVDFSYDNDTCTSSGTQGCTPDDAASVGHSSQNDDTQMMTASDAWGSLAMDAGNFHGSTMDQLSSHIFHPVPVSPPLTEASNDMSVTSSCSNSGYSFHAHDDAFFGDLTSTTIGGQTINLGDPLFPLTPPLSEQDRNRLDTYTIPPSYETENTDNVVAGLLDLPNRHRGHCSQRPQAETRENQTQSFILPCLLESLFANAPRMDPRFALPGTTHTILCQPRPMENITARLPLERSPVTTLLLLRSALTSEFLYFSVVIVTGY